MIAIFSSAFSSFDTSKKGRLSRGDERAKTAPDLPAELAAADSALTETDDRAAETDKDDEKGEGERASVKRGLTAGQLVRIVMPGSSLDGIETRVLALTSNVLGQPVYRLDHQRQGQAITLPAECLQVIEVHTVATAAEAGVIRATAAQLLQVLGKACPFAGPGLWSVSRDEVSAQAWGQLRRLVWEM